MADPTSFDSDPNPTVYFDSEPVSVTLKMWIRIHIKCLRPAAVYCDLCNVYLPVSVSNSQIITHSQHPFSLRSNSCHIPDRAVVCESEFEKRPYRPGDGILK